MWRILKYIASKLLTPENTVNHIKQVYRSHKKRLSKSVHPRDFEGLGPVSGADQRSRLYSIVVGTDPEANCPSLDVKSVFHRPDHVGLTAAAQVLAGWTLLREPGGQVKGLPCCFSVFLHNGL